MNPIVLHQKQKVEQDEQASEGNFSLFHLLAEWIEDIETNGDDMQTVEPSTDAEVV